MQRANSCSKFMRFSNLLELYRLSACDISKLEDVLTSDTICEFRRLELKLWPPSCWVTRYLSWHVPCFSCFLESCTTLYKYCFMHRGVVSNPQRQRSQPPMLLNTVLFDLIYGILVNPAVFLKMLLHLLYMKLKLVVALQFHTFQFHVFVAG